MFYKVNLFYGGELPDQELGTSSLSLAEQWVNGAEHGTIKKLSMDEVRDELKSACESHDWTYMYSDDPRSYRNGREQRSYIQELMTALGDPVMARALYDMYNPLNKNDE
tara:strand:- start:1110 stop:1436 length:327 start_codon:yes stop_codon:yes gene_type:complete